MAEASLVVSNGQGAGPVNPSDSWVLHGFSDYFRRHPTAALSCGALRFHCGVVWDVVLFFARRYHCRCRKRELGSLRPYLSSTSLHTPHTILCRISLLSPSSVPGMNRSRQSGGSSSVLRTSHCLFGQAIIPECFSHPFTARSPPTCHPSLSPVFSGIVQTLPIPLPNPCQTRQIPRSQEKSIAILFSDSVRAWSRKIKPISIPSSILIASLKAKHIRLCRCTLSSCLAYIDLRAIEADLKSQNLNARSIAIISPTVLEAASAGDFAP